jgi:outer membrane receptor for Fe3+-dicitrate
MAQSPEYPDLPWLPPKSWTDASRSGVQLIVIHSTEGSSHAQSAEDGAGYDQRRTDGTSARYFVDSDSIVQCVRTADQAHTARAQGNKRGIHYELCARAAWNDDPIRTVDTHLPAVNIRQCEVAF